MVIDPCLTDSKAAVSDLNACISHHCLTECYFLNQGFCEEDKNDQTYSQEDLEYENTLRALEQEDIPKWMIDRLKVYLLEQGQAMDVPLGKI